MEGLIDKNGFRFLKKEHGKVIQCYEQGPGILL